MDVNGLFYLDLLSAITKRHYLKSILDAMTDVTGINCVLRSQAAAAPLLITRPCPRILQRGDPLHIYHSNIRSTVGQQYGPCLPLSGRTCISSTVSEGNGEKYVGGLPLKDRIDSRSCSESMQRRRDIWDSRGEDD